MISYWSTLGQLLSNHWSTKTPLVLLATRAHCWLVVNPWSTVVQPLVNQNTIGLLGHQSPLLARGQPLVNPWSTVVRPLVNQNTIGLLGHLGTTLPHGQLSADQSEQRKGRVGVVHPMHQEQSGGSGPCISCNGSRGRVGLGSLHPGVTIPAPLLRVHWEEAVLYMEPCAHCNTEQSGATQGNATQSNTEQ